MACIKYRKLISAYADSETNILESSAVSQHVKNCPECRTELGNQFTLKSMVQDSFSRSEDVNFSVNIMAKINSGATARVVEPKKFNFRPFVAAAMIAIMTAFALMGYNDGRQQLAATNGLENFVFSHADQYSSLVESTRVVSVNYER